MFAKRRMIQASQGPWKQNALWEKRHVWIIEIIVDYKRQHIKDLAVSSRQLASQDIFSGASGVFLKKNGQQPQTF